MAKRLLVALASTPAALIGCHASEDGLPVDPPTSVTRVSSGGFQSPTDAVASPDGRTFYFAAWDMDQQPTLFQVASEPGSAPRALAAGGPLEAPLGLVMSCDGKTIYVADMGGEAGAILAASTSGGAATAVGATGLTRPGGVAMAPDCRSLFATGRLDDGTPALFNVPLGGGAARVVYQGAPLVAPSGLHVDSQGVAWVMDHHAQGAAGEGVLFAIPSDGSKATEVMSDLRMGTPGGVSLTAGGGTAVMPTRDADGHAQLTSVDIATGQVTQLPAPDMADPAGLRSARQAGVFVVVDSEAGTIYRAE
jgi:DNA-binding beta-propeller fold protein YncE